MIELDSSRCGLIVLASHSSLK